MPVWLIDWQASAPGSGYPGLIARLAIKNGLAGFARPGNEPGLAGFARPGKLGPAWQAHLALTALVGLPV